MALLDGLVQGRTVISEDGDGRIEPVPGPPLDRPVTVGIWPEDVELGEPDLPGFVAARVWATDYRGMDRAIRLQAGEAFLRLVVPLDRPLARGDAVGFRVPPERVILVGIGMLVQPWSEALFGWGFPVGLDGTLAFAVLDRLPAQDG